MFAKIISNTNELNSDMQCQVRNNAAAIQQSKDYLFENREVMSSDETVRQCIENYSILDSLANRFKVQRVRSITALFALIVSAFVWFELHVKVFSHMDSLPPHLPTFVYLTLVISIVAVYVRAKRGRYDEKHEDYRVLAEAMRVQIVWRLAGITDSVVDYCIPRQVGELSWIRVALFGFLYSHSNKPAVADPDLDYVRVQWVEGQGKWYRGKTQSNAHSVRRVTKIGRALLVASAGIALLLCVPLFSPHLATEGWSLWVSKTLVMLVAAFLAVAAARHGYVEMWLGPSKPTNMIV